MEYVYLALICLFFVASGALIAKGNLFGVFTMFFGGVSVIPYKEELKAIKIKSTEKLELIETITTQTDTIFKYEIKSKALEALEDFKRNQE